MVLTGDSLLWLVLIINVVCCAFMCGLTTFVHVVHYPSFRFANPDTGTAFHHFHTSRTGLVVAFPMLAELGTSVALVLLSSGSVWFWPFVVAGLLLAFVWFETAFRVIPQHTLISKTSMRDDKVLSALCRANLARTIAWNVKLFLLIVIIVTGPM